MSQPILGYCHHGERLAKVPAGYLTCLAQARPAPQQAPHVCQVGQQHNLFVIRRGAGSLGSERTGRVM